MHLWSSASLLFCLQTTATSNPTTQQRQRCPFEEQTVEFHDTLLFLHSGTFVVRRRFSSISVRSSFSSTKTKVHVWHYYGHEVIRMAQRSSTPPPAYCRGVIGFNRCRPADHITAKSLESMTEPTRRPIDRPTAKLIRILVKTAKSLRYESPTAYSVKLSDAGLNVSLLDTSKEIYDKI
ncbi:hypothetical protein KIN20_006272 [Parelaphostrongylus tenuis]|uniref:Uncharacterized protein n=1 Tax=Parelaphostrongylus tenuis TaxID=148309 RepID=A0AAD5MMD3_PARTN|nr:hypothetical protein KIN20_006272 [Parelaphostrongylus tenuis]